jgi:hypothetical protein
VRGRSRAVPNVEIGFDIGILREILTFSRENLIADLAGKIFPVLTHEAKFSRQECEGLVQAQCHANALARRAHALTSLFVDSKFSHF